MKKLVIRKKTSDNVYFHPDFHIVMNVGIKYLEKNYGDEVVKDYLRQFSRSYHKPLIGKIKKHGLKPLKRYIEQIYKKEGGKITSHFDKNTLKIKIEKCPAVPYMRKQKVSVAKSFVETTKTVYETIVEKTSYAFEMCNYDEKTGKATLIFRRKN
ncbi:MAG: hypothetical protein ACP5JO_09340 [Candidatus Ratteibacteria bacterium]